MTWIIDNLGLIVGLAAVHLQQSVIALVLGVVASVPLGWIAWRYRLVRGPVIVLTGLLYTIPSLAAFALLIPYTGLTSRATVLIPLVSYTLVILVRNTLTGLDSVPAAASEAANGMGFSSRQRLLRVEFPLALPTIMAGIRLATVSTIGLVTVSAIIGQRSLGILIRDGLERDFRTLIVVGAGLAVLLAFVADLFLAAVTRLATPWTRGH